MKMYETGYNIFSKSISVQNSQTGTNNNSPIRYPLNKASQNNLTEISFGLSVRALKCQLSKAKEALATMFQENQEAVIKPVVQTARDRNDARACIKQFSSLLKCRNFEEEINNLVGNSEKLSNIRTHIEGELSGYSHSDKYEILDDFHLEIYGFKYGDKKVDELYDLLVAHSQEKKKLQAAADEIIKIAQPEDVEFVKDLLTSANPEERNIAVYIIGKIGNSSNIDDIKGLLDDMHKNVVESAFKAFGAIAEPLQIDILKPYMIHKNGSIRDDAVSAVRAIGKRGKINLSEVLKPYENEQKYHVIRQIILTFKEIAEKTDIPSLEKYLDTKYDKDLRLLTVESLGDIEKRLCVDLSAKFKEMFNDKDIMVRQAAEKAFGINKTNARLEVEQWAWKLKEISDFLKSPEYTEEVKKLSKSVKADNFDKYDKKNMSEKRLRDTYLYNDTYKKDDAYMRKFVSAMGDRIISQGKNEDLELIKEFLSDGNDALRQTAARIYGKLGRESNIAELKDLLFSNNTDEVRVEAFKTVSGLINSSENLKVFDIFVNDKLDEIRIIISSAYADKGCQMYLKQIKSYLGDANAEVRENAVEGLYKHGQKNDIDLLEPLARDDNARVRNKVIEAVSEKGSTKHLDMIDHLLEDEWKPNKNDAIKAFGKLGEGRHADRLFDLITDVYKDKDLIKEAAKAYKNIRPICGPGIEKIIETAYKD